MPEHSHKDEFLTKVKEAAFEYIHGLGFEIVEVSFSKTRGGLIVRFLIDKPTGGISIEECCSLNESLGELLDKENIIEGRYILEVSSPGVDRPLMTEKDFRRVSGRRVRVFLREPVGKRCEMEGIVNEVKNNFLILSQEGTVINVPLSNIKKAKQVII